MINTETIKKELVAAIPQDLIRERADRNDLLSTLKKRRDGYETALQDKAVSSGVDGGKALARIEALTRDVDGLKRLVNMTEDEIARVEDLLVETRGKISEELSRAVLEKRLLIAAELETKIMAIENDLNTWRSATAEAAASVDCDLQAGTDVFVKSRTLKDHLL